MLLIKSMQFLVFVIMVSLKSNSHPQQECQLLKSDITTRKLWHSFIFDYVFNFDYQFGPFTRPKYVYFMFVKGF